MLNKLCQNEKKKKTTPKFELTKSFREYTSLELTEMTLENL